YTDWTSSCSSRASISRSTAAASLPSTFTVDCGTMSTRASSTGIPCPPTPGRDTPQPPRGLLALDLHRGLRPHVPPRLEHRHPLPLQRLAHRFHFIRTRGNLEHFFDLLDVGGPRIQRLFEQIVLLHLLGVHFDHPAAVEHPRHAARGAHPPLVLLEDGSDLGPCAGLVCV